MAQYLGPIDADPVEGRMWENIAKKTSQIFITITTKRVYMLFLKKTSTTHSDIIIEICLPRQLLREEVIHAGSSDQLRQSSRQPKGIG